MKEPANCRKPFLAKLREKAELYLQSLIINTIEKSDDAKIDEDCLSAVVARGIPGYLELEVGAANSAAHFRSGQKPRRAECREHSLADLPEHRSDFHALWFGA